MSVKAAKQERELAVREIERLTQRVADLDAYIRVHTTLRPGAGEKTPRHRDSAAKENLAKLIAEFLEGGIYMKTADIVAALKATAANIPGADPEGYVSQLMSRDKKRFKANRKLGWSLSSANNVLPIARGAP